MRPIAFLTVMVVVVATQADVTFRFDPDDLIQAAPSAAGTSDVSGQNKATQPNARRTHQQWASNWAETFHNPALPQPQPDSYNTYMNWRDGLGAGEGISGFNIWLQDNPRARSWGEAMVWDPLGAAPTGTAATGWNVATIPNPWGTGWLVEWWTDDPTYYINSISDIGDFSFSGTAFWDVDANGYDAGDPEVQIGEMSRIWFGAVNWTEADGRGGWTYEWSLHFDDDWGTAYGPSAAPWSAGRLDSEGYGAGYEGVLGITAIPAPGAALLGAIGLGTLAWVRRRI